jgi:transcriptional regulator with XRE-family HTH domain
LPGRAVRMDEGFGIRLKQAMARRSVRPTQLAADLGVLPQTVSRWRRGECPDDLRLPRIADYLRINAEWLRLGVGEIEPEIHSGGPGSPAEPRSPPGAAPGTAPRSPGRRAADEVRREIAEHMADNLPIRWSKVLEWVERVERRTPSPPARPGREGNHPRPGPAPAAGPPQTPAPRPPLGPGSVPAAPRHSSPERSGPAPGA